MKSKMRIAELLEQAASSFEKGKQETQEFKPTLAEYLKLVQLAKDFEEEDLREVKVTWVDPTARAPRKS